MSGAEIDYIITETPADVPLPYTAPEDLTEFSDVADPVRSILQKRGSLLLQPDFCYNYCLVFAQLKRQLPGLALLPDYKRNWLLHMTDILTGWYDANSEVVRAIEYALQLTHRNWDVHRNTIDSLLLHKKELNYTQIGACVGGIPGVVIDIYGQFFWNVRDRWEDGPYRVSLAYSGQERKMAELDPNYLYNVASRDRLLRTGYNYGTVAVLEMAGLIPEDEVQTSQSPYMVEQTIMHRARRELQWGGGHGDYPATRQAMRTIQSSHIGGQDSKTAEDVGGIGKLHEKFPVMETLDRIQRPDIVKMLTLSQGEPVKLPQNDGAADKRAEKGSERLPANVKPPKNWMEY